MRGRVTAELMRHNCTLSGGYVNELMRGRVTTELVKHNCTLSGGYVNELNVR